MKGTVNRCYTTRASSFAGLLSGSQLMGCYDPELSITFLAI